jgi:hypothetical protein
MGAFRTANATVSAHGARAVTPSDSTVLEMCRSLFVGTGGNLNVRMADGMTLVFTNVPAGIFPIQVDQVLSTSTTASNIVALY